MINERLEDIINKFELDECRPSNNSGLDEDLEEWLKCKMALDLLESPFDMASENNFSSHLKEFTYECP